jgi:hypothetical protein
MAIIIKIQVNHKILMVISATRITDVKKRGELNEYRVTKMDYREEEDGELTISGTITHRCGDPVEILTINAIEKGLNS